MGSIPIAGSRNFPYPTDRIKLMPGAWRTNNKSILKKVNRPGFTLIEILLTLLIILAMVSILFAASGTFVSSRNANLQGVATKIASREIENLRNMQYSSLPPTGSISDPDLSKLPSATATRTMADYEASSKIKQVTINVNWIENGASRQIKVETLISENGL